MSSAVAYINTSIKTVHGLFEDFTGIRHRAVIGGSNVFWVIGFPFPRNMVCHIPRSSSHELSRRRSIITLDLRARTDFRLTHRGLRRARTWKDAAQEWTTVKWFITLFLPWFSNSFVLISSPGTLAELYVTLRETSRKVKSVMQRDRKIPCLHYVNAIKIDEWFNA